MISRLFQHLLREIVNVELYILWSNSAVGQGNKRTRQAQPVKLSVDSSSLQLLQRSLVYFRPAMTAFSRILEVNSVVAKHTEVKERVVQTLSDLMQRAEGLVCEKVEEEMKSTVVKMAGRGIVIVSTVISFFYPIAAMGLVVGYLVVGCGKLYKIKCKQNHAKRLDDIRAEVRRAVEEYVDSLKNVFSELETLGAFDAEKGFAENLKVIDDIVKKAEDEARMEGIDTFFSEIWDVITKLKRRFNKLSPEQKKKLNSKDFLATYNSLTPIGETVPGGDALGQTDAAIGAVSVGGELLGGGLGGGSLPAAVRSLPWPAMFKAFHAINLVVNAGFLISNLKEFRELNKMRKDYQNEDEKGEARKKMLEKYEKKFEKEIKMRYIIEKIRDTINRDGY